MAALTHVILTVAPLKWWKRSGAVLTVISYTERQLDSSGFRVVGGYGPLVMASVCLWPYVTYVYFV